MSACAVRRGFFILRDCGEPSVYTCNECGRSMCAEHTIQEGGQTFCVECSTRHAGSAPDGAFAASLLAWPLLFRHYFYGSSNYNPIYRGNRLDNYYDMYDLRSFSKKRQGPLEDEDDQRTSIMDS